MAYSARVVSHSSKTPQNLVEAEKRYDVGRRRKQVQNICATDVRFQFYASDVIPHSIANTNFSQTWNI